MAYRYVPPAGEAVTAQRNETLSESEKDFKYRIFR